MSSGSPLALSCPRPARSPLTPDAPCHPDGALTFISMPISLMQRNIKATGGAASYALATPREQDRHNEYAIPRVSFVGVSRMCLSHSPGI